MYVKERKNLKGGFGGFILFVNGKRKRDEEGTCAWELLA